MFTAKKLERKTNLNNVNRTGLYYYPVNSRIEETPSGKECSWGLLLVVEQEDGQFQQILISFGNLYYRQRLEIGGWSPWTNLSTGMEAYVLNPASTEEIGGIKIGSGLTIDDEGVLTAEKYKLPFASKETIGGIRVGENLSINSAGVLSANYQVYCLPYATETRLGGIKLGSGLYMDDLGRVNVQFPGNGQPQIINKVEEHSEVIENPYELPIASSDVLGGIKIGENLNISKDGTVSVEKYNLPISSETEIGGIKVDGNVFSTSEDGFLQISSDVLPPKNKKEFSYELNGDNYLISLSLEEQVDFLNKVVIATMIQSGMLGGYESDFHIPAKKEKTEEEVILSLDVAMILDLYINGFNAN